MSAELGDVHEPSPREQGTDAVPDPADIPLEYARAYLERHGSVRSPGAPPPCPMCRRWEQVEIVPSEGLRRLFRRHRYRCRTCGTAW